MGLKPSDLWTWRGTISRQDYAAWGIILFALKYNLDRMIAFKGHGVVWYPWSYFLGPERAGVQVTDLGLTLLAVSLPFIAWGVILTLRRLRDAGWKPWLVALFFVPLVNVIFFGLLCVQPTRDTVAPPLQDVSRRPRWLYPESGTGAAVLGILISIILGSALAAFGTTFLKNYGWGLFVGIPFMMGLSSSLFYATSAPRTLGQCLGVSCLSVAITSGVLLALALEGILCIAMAAPIALVLAMLGGFAAYWIQIERWSRRLNATHVHGLGWLLLPFLMAAESTLPKNAPLIAATTVCEINAPVDVVWRHVVTFSELPPPTESIFRAGIAYPVRARLVGHGVGAVRYCEFSTGPFVEPITAWEENRRLAFDVVKQPHPMEEWSPYQHIQPAHLEGFFVSRRGEFRLTPLPANRTRLEGTTWYQQDIWPNRYWQLWSDHLVHAIHRRVLEHIRVESESSASL